MHGLTHEGIPMRHKINLQSKWLRTAIAATIGTASIAIILLWLMGAFRDKLPTGAPGEVLLEVGDAPTHQVRAKEVPIVETAVGSIEATRRIRVGSRLMARVKALHVEPSQNVAKGDLLVELDDQDLLAAVSEGEAALQSAKAAREQAAIDLERSTALLQQGIASRGRVDRDETALERAKADVERLNELLSQARTRLDFATIRAPSAGIVVDKHVEPGNLAIPGQDLVTLYDPTQLQLVASVRESLAVRLRPGDKVGVRLDSLDLYCEATIARIIPEAARQSRSFRVEVTGPCPPGILSGMFGRLEMRVGERSEIHIPRKALRRVGQIDLAFVVQPTGRVLRRFVRVGRTVAPDEIEILSGLRDGETVLASAPDPVDG